MNSTLIKLTHPVKLQDIGGRGRNKEHGQLVLNYPTFNSARKLSLIRHRTEEMLARKTETAGQKAW